MLDFDSFAGNRSITGESIEKFDGNYIADAYKSHKRTNHEHYRRPENGRING